MEVKLTKDFIRDGKKLFGTEFIFNGLENELFDVEETLDESYIVSNRKLEGTRQVFKNFLIQVLTPNEDEMRCPHCYEVYGREDFPDLYNYNGELKNEQEATFFAMQKDGYNIMTCPKCGCVILKGLLK